MTTNVTFGGGGGGAKCVKSVKFYLNGPLSRMLSRTCNGWL
jgi:hypothetical protein